MADLFVNDGGSNTAPYETWAKAATTFLVAVDAAAAGDDIFIGADHSEDPPDTVVYDFPGTAAAPNRVISTTVDTTTYNKADNIQIDNTGTSHSISIRNHVKFYGVNMLAGNDILMTNDGANILFDDSVIAVARVNNGVFSIGSNNGEIFSDLKNSDINFTGGGTTSIISLGSTGRFRWRGGTLLHSGTQPTALFDGLDRNSDAWIEGVDLSSITSALVDISHSADALISFHHCTLNSSVSITTGTIINPGFKVLAVGCDDTTGNKLYRLFYQDYYGSIVDDDAIFRDDGAKDPDGNNISWKMVTTGNAKEFSESMESPPITAWVDSTGSKTFTVHLDWDNATSIEDDEIWLDVEALEDSASPESTFSNDRTVDVLATPAAQTTSTEAWTGTGGFSNEQKRKLEVTRTINRVGPVICRVHLAKPSVTVYVDPKVEVS